MCTEHPCKSNDARGRSEDGGNAKDENCRMAVVGNVPGDLFGYSVCLSSEFLHLLSLLQIQGFNIIAMRPAKRS